MSTDSNMVRKKKWRRGAAAVTGVALVGVAFAVQGGGSPLVTASSHREAPLIAGDPRADNTDVYAFDSPDDPSSVTLISDWIPFEEPNGGPNFYTWADDTKYNIKIDNDGDAVADLTYTWIFSTVVRDASRDFLSNLGPVTSLTDPDLNVYQTYDLTVTNGAGVTTVLAGDGDGEHSANDPIAAPSIAGSASMPDYTPLRDQAIINLNGGGKGFVGQSDDPFFLDLRVFDLLYGGDASKVGQDTLAGYNVNQVALQIPKTALALNGDPTATGNPVIGIWSTTEERNAGNPGDLADPTQFTQVSRLGNPLVNEVVMPLALKDAFNAISPDIDATLPPVVAAVETPRLPELVQAIYKVPAPATPRNDLTEIFLQGISKANAGLSGDPAVVLPVDLNSLGLNRDVTSVQPSEMLRLNMSVPVNPNPNRYGVLAGDVQGFPNGRRLTDDVVDIAVQAVEGAAQTGKLVSGLLTVDSVDRNDRPFGTTFPYTALPHVESVNTGTERTPRAPEIVSINPTRVLETRTTEPSGQIGYTGAQPAAGREVHVKVTGPGLAPADASAVVLNITATNSADGFVTAYACGDPRPSTSNLNPAAGKITHNLVVAKVGTNGEVCLFTYAATDLIVDLSGFHPSGSAYAPNAPERLLETRTGQPGGQKGYTAATKPAAGSTIELQVTGTGAANLPADTKAVFLNITTVNTDAAGWLVAYPCGSPRPTSASNINQIPGQVRANLVTAKVGVDGKVCLFTYSATDIVVDLMGSAPSTSPFVATAPERVLETRASEGQINYSAARPVPGQTIEVKVIGFGTTNIPADAGTVVLNVTAVDPANAGVITVFPCGSPAPLASNGNLQGVTDASLVSVKVGDGGRVCIKTTGATDLIADILGYYPGTELV